MTYIGLLILAFGLLLLTLVSVPAISRRMRGLSDTKLPGGIHYSWVIVAILALVQMVGQSIGMAAGIMVAPLHDPDGAFGWGMATIGAALGLYYLTGAIFAPISGWLGDRYGARRTMLAGGLLYGSSMLLLGIISQAWHFFIVFSFMLAITQSISMVPLIAAVNGWFRRRLGLGVGVLWAAGGAGAALLAPLVGFLLVYAGWQGTFWTFGIVGGTIILLLTIFFRNRPADVGIQPYGARDDDPPEAVRSQATEKLRLRVFNQHIRRTKEFWNLPLIHGLGCAGHGVVLIYVIPIAVDQGISLTAAAVILSLINLFSIGSRFITPMVTERFGGKPAMIAALSIQCITVQILFWAQDPWAFYLFAMLFGIGFGGEMSAYPVVNRQYFGRGPLATFYGFEMTGAMFGHALATVLAGLIIYVTFSFSPIIILSAAFSLAGAVVILTLAPSNRILIPDWEESLPPEARSTPLDARVSAEAALLESVSEAD